MGTERIKKNLRVALVGAGPAGFYTAAELLKKIPEIHIGIFDRLFAPFGLVRYGVAPDHPHTRRVLRAFEKTAADPRVALWGQVHVGHDLSVAELQQYFDAVVITSGAEADRRLNIPGETLTGCFSSMQFVGWYNSHPDFHDLPVDLSCQAAVIIGNGNVALDVARLLLKPVDRWTGTDIAPPALEALQTSRLREVHIIGRRGPAQTSFRQNEMLEIGQLEGCAFHVREADLALAPEDQQVLNSHEGLTQRQVVEQLNDVAGRAAAGARSRHLHFHFYRSPVEILGDGGVDGIRLAQTRLTGPAGNRKAVPAGAVGELPCGLVITCVGHRGVALPGLPFNAENGRIPAKKGRVEDKGSVLPGLYATGWIARGATGLIGNNKPDAMETVVAILEDAPVLRPCAQPDDAALRKLLAGREIHPVSHADWVKIDAEEIRRGAAYGLARVKFTGAGEAAAWLQSNPA